jgi:uncharacterized membrane protein
VSFAAKGPLVSADEDKIPSLDVPEAARRQSFADDFRRFFTRGLAALLPTLITLGLLLWAWNFLWDSLGQYIIWLIKWTWLELVEAHVFQFQTAGYIGRYWDPDVYPFRTHLLGVGLAVLLVYIVGVLVGNLIGRAAWRLAERGVMRIPLVRAIYPAVKQVTDFVLEDHQSPRLAGSRVVAVQPHEQGIWSIGMVTGRANWPLDLGRPQEMVTVFVPSTPTAFTGYVLVVPRTRVVELPMSVEEALRLLVTGGVIAPPEQAKVQIPPAIVRVG